MTFHRLHGWGDLDRDQNVMSGLHIDRNPKRTGVTDALGAQCSRVGYAVQNGLPRVFESTRWSVIPSRSVVKVTD